MKCEDFCIKVLLVKNKMMNPLIGVYSVVANMSTAARQHMAFVLKIDSISWIISVSYGQ